MDLLARMDSALEAPVGEGASECIRQARPDGYTAMRRLAGARFFCAAL
jgi:hypothetical protein